MEALSLQAVEVTLGAVTALSDLSLSVAAGERVAVIGASGAGKSTLFEVLTRSVRLTAGSVTVHGVDLMSLSDSALRAARRRIGVIYQSYSLVPQLSAGMNVALGEVGELSNRAALRTLVRGPGPGSSKRVAAALEQVGLADRVGDRVADLSGGQQQRVAVARVLLQRPQLILADEPVSAVDPVTGRRVLGALLDLAGQHATLLVSLHDVALARRFPRIVALRGGAVVFDGRPEELEEAAVEEIYSGEPLDQGRPGVLAPAPGRHCDPTAVIREREGYGLRAR